VRYLTEVPLPPGLKSEINAAIQLGKAERAVLMGATRPVPPPPAPETEVTFDCGCNRMPNEGEYCSQHNIGVSHAG
jgi:hypothetical protein